MSSFNEFIEANKELNSDIFNTYPFLQKNLIFILLIKNMLI